MTKIIHLKPQEDVEVDTAFIDLLDQHCNQEGAIKPLSNALFGRIEQLKLKAEAAKQRRENVLLEG